MGVDISGTKLLVGAVDGQGNILKKVREPLPNDPQEGLKKIKAMIRAVAASEKIKAIGAGCGSPLDWKNGVILGPVNIPTWNNVEIKKIMEEEFGCPFFIDNDHNAASMAEKRFGLGKGVKNFVYANISTGVGGGIVIDGKIYRGKNGEHPEIGHQSIKWKVEGKEGDIGCPCGSKNCLEATVSATSIRKIYGKAPENLSDGEMREVGRNFGCGLKNVIILYAPDLIILGGGVILGARERIMQPANDFLKEEVTLLPLPEFKFSELGHDVCMLGAAAIAMEAEKSGELR